MNWGDLLNLIWEPALYISGWTLAFCIYLRLGRIANRLDYLAYNEAIKNPTSEDAKEFFRLILQQQQANQ